MIGREYLQELINNNWKFTEKEIVFITKDKEGTLIWLERGNRTAGLEHIISRHAYDFESAFSLKENEIPLYLYNAITYGDIIRSTPSKIPGGIDRVYKYDGQYYTFVGLGGNGFIVTAHPTSIRRE